VRIIKGVGLLAGLVVVTVLTVASMQPDTFRRERQVVIERAPGHIFPLINNFHQWEAWSPWEKIDPQLQRSYRGPDAGPGAVYAWKGNGQVGQGSMEIVESQAPGKVLIRLDFTAPFEAHNTVEFSLMPQGTSTVVTQAMYGPSPLVSKVMGLFFSMDKMVGDKYEEGLASLKALAER
jgi:hypothetical protein